MNDDLCRTSFCVSLLDAPSSSRLPSPLGRRLAVAVLLGAVGAATTGRAEQAVAPRAEGAEREAQARRADFGVGVELAAGLAYSWWLTRQETNAASDQMGGQASIQMGGQASIRWRALRLAALADVNSTLFGPTISHYGIGIGWVWMASPAIQFDALVEGGASSYAKVGERFFVTSVSGATSAVIFFAGVRVGLAWRFARILILGALLEAREDVTRVTLSPTVTTCFVQCSSHQEQWTVGGTALGASLRFGVEL